MEGPPVGPGGDLPLRLPGLAHGKLPGDRDHCVEGRADVLQAAEEGLRQLHGRDLAGAEELGQLPYGEEDDALLHVHSWSAR